METPVPLLVPESLALVGVDVSKTSLDACLLPPGKKPRERRFANDEHGIAALLAWANELGACGVGREATGGYEEPLARAAHGAGLAVRVENPCRVRGFAKATGRLNKTDRADARAIAEFLAKVRGRPWKPASAVAWELEALTSRRRELMEERTRLGNRLERRAALLALVAEQIEGRLGQVERDLEAVEKARRRLVAADGALARDAAALQGIVGVGEASALLILARAGNVEDYASAQSYAAAAGLAPCRRESGSWRGRTRISRQGDASLRSGLYLAAVVASTRDPLMRAFKERLLQRGKAPKEAIVACLRKLLMRVYGVLKAVRAGKEPYYGERPDATKRRKSPDET